MCGKCGSAATRALKAGAAALAALAVGSPAVEADARATKRPHFMTRLSDAAPSVIQDMRYAGAYNFVGEPIEGYQAGVCWLHRDAARALAKAQERLLKDGYTLIVYDCYRPARAVRLFNRWLNDSAAPKMRRVFHPDLDKKGVKRGRYIAARSNHARGAAVDLALARVGYQPRDVAEADPNIRCDAPFAERFPDTDLDFGTGYDCFSALSHTASRKISKEAQANRARLLRAMRSAGFSNYRREWWHFDYRGAELPNVQWDFPVR